jgi:hypothetical protein
MKLKALPPPGLIAAIGYLVAKNVMERHSAMGFIAYRKKQEW